MFETKATQIPGLLEDSFDPRDIWLDELEDSLGGDILPPAFLWEDLDFEPQGAYPYCVSFATTKLLEHKRKKMGLDPVSFSQAHLFHHSGGSRVGSYFRANLETARQKGCIDYGFLPMPANLWETDEFDAQKDRALSTPFNDAKKILGYAKVANDSDSIKRAIMKHGPLMVGVKASGGYWSEYVKRPTGQRDDHAVVLAGWDKKGWIIFDSLQPRTGFNGYHTLASDYGFSSAFAIVELPEDWKAKIEEKRKDGFDHCLNHYGQPRNYAREVEVAAEMVKEFKKFNNQSVWEAAGKFWGVYTNAIVYGSYSLSYRKFGVWQPGDVINDCYHWRRTGKHLFDFNQLRAK